MWQFTEAVRGLADGCLTLGIPVTGGNVSFYNQTGTAAIQPTPGHRRAGRARRRARAGCRSGFSPAGATLLLLGETRPELGGSLWARVAHGHLGGRPPAVDLAAERALAQVLVTAAAARACWPPRTTCPTAGWPWRWPSPAWPAAWARAVTLPGDAFTLLFSESAGRALVAVGPAGPRGGVRGAARRGRACPAT